jgi:hypothetical protein
MKAICIKPIIEHINWETITLSEGVIYEYELMIDTAQATFGRVYQVMINNNPYSMKPEFFNKHLKTIDEHREKQLDKLLNEDKSHLY